MRVKVNAVVIVTLLCLGFPMLQAESAYDQSNTQTEQITVDDLVGVWKTNESTARFKVSVEKRQIVIEGWDSKDNERFEISNISLEGRTLRFTTRMPSTNWTVHRECIITNSKEMQVYRSGATTKSTKYFKE